MSLPDNLEMFVLYRTGKIGRVGGLPYVDGVEEQVAWLAGLHPELNFFWAPVGSVVSS